MALGKNVKRLRLARGWVLKDLSEASGVPIGTIHALENRDSIRSQYAAELAKALNVSMEELTSGDDVIDVQAVVVTAKQIPASFDPVPANQLREFVEALGQAIRGANPYDRVSIKSYLDQYVDDPGDPILIDRIVNILSPPKPSQKPTPETGALKRAA